MSDNLTARSIPAQKVETNRNDQQEVPDSRMKEMLESDLLELKKWAETAVEPSQLLSTEKRLAFYNFFRGAIRDEYNRYKSHKTTAWSFVKNIPWMIGSATLPVLSALASHFAVQGENATLEISWLIAGLIAATWIVIKIYTDRIKNKNAKETWVRHSVCFHRLQLELSRFLLSERSERDYHVFYETSFAILNQNLDQFALNLSSQGLAERSKLEVNG